MSAAGGGTFRNRTVGRGHIPFDGSPSGIPRKVDQGHQGMPPTATPSDIGSASALSTSRQKQSKRDEVKFAPSVFPLTFN